MCSPNYVFDVDRQQEGSDQFKQLVWRDTKKVGIARSTFEKHGNFCTVIVARYSPPANRANSRSNVPRGSFDRDSYCNGLGKSSDFTRESAHTRNAIAQESSNTQGTNILFPLKHRPYDTGFPENNTVQGLKGYFSKCFN